MLIIKLKDARNLIHQNKGKFTYVNRIDNGSYVEVIFKEKDCSQLYSFWYHNSDDPDLGITIDTIQKFDSFLGDDDNLDVVTKVIENN